MSEPISSFFQRRGLKIGKMARRAKEATLAYIERVLRAGLFIPFGENELSPEKMEEIMAEAERIAERYKLTYSENIMKSMQPMKEGAPPRQDGPQSDYGLTTRPDGMDAFLVHEGEDPSFAYAGALAFERGKDGQVSSMKISGLPETQNKILKTMLVAQYREAAESHKNDPAGQTWELAIQAPKAAEPMIRRAMEELASEYPNDLGHMVMEAEDGKRTTMQSLKQQHASQKQTKAALNAMSPFATSPGMKAI